MVIADIQDDPGLTVADSIGLGGCRYIHCDVTLEPKSSPMPISVVEKATFISQNLNDCLGDSYLS